MEFSVLVVHDDSAKLSAIIDAVRCSGVDDVVSSGCVATARQALRSRRFDVLIIDIALPDRKGEHPDPRAGVKFLEEVLRRKYPKPTCVLGVTASDESDSDVDDFFQKNFWQVIRTPAVGREWLDSIERLVRYHIESKNPPSFSEYKSDVFVVCALKQTELSAVLKLDNGWRERLPLDEASYFHKGSFISGGCRYDISTGSPPKVGLVHMALYVQKVIYTLRPRYIVMPGICAGYKDTTGIGDVVVADPAWGWQSGKYIDGPPHFKIEPDQITLADFVSERFIQLADKKEFFCRLHEEWQGNKPNSRPKLIVAPTASGSAVLADNDMMNHIREQNRKVASVEMEAYALYASAKNASHPKPTFFALKSVCDFGDGEKNDNYQAYSAHVSAEVLQEFLNESYHEIKDFAGRA